MTNRRGPPRASAQAPRRRRQLALLSAVGVLLLLLLLWRGRSPDRGTPPEPEPGQTPSVETQRLSPPAGSATHGAPRPLDSAALAQGAPPGIREMPPPLPDEPFPYPPWSQPLTEGSDPATTVAEDNPVDAKSGLHVVLGPRRQVVHPPDAIVIDMKVLNRLGAAVAVGDPVVRFRPDRTTVESGPWFEVPFTDDGSHAYVATFFPSSEQQAALFKGGEHVFVEVKLEAPDGLGLRRYPLIVMYSRQPHAKIAGKYSDTVAGGNLVVSVGVTATQPGKYRLIGSLYAGDGQRAIAFATATTSVEQGDGTVALTFFGKVLHDSGIDGPYDLRYLMLFEQVQEGEEIPGETVDNAYTTAAYRATSFSAAAYQPPPPDYPVVDMNSPSQQGKPPPMFPERPAPGPVEHPPVTIGKGPPTK
ncbi:MAG TPA: hypothetical protein VIF15_03995 [Polyangiaceae bacterium]